jgi:hypothetical protein
MKNELEIRHELINSVRELTQSLYKNELEDYQEHIAESYHQLLDGDYISGQAEMTDFVASIMALFLDSDITEKLKENKIYNPGEKLHRLYHFFSMSEIFKEEIKRFAYLHSTVSFSNQDLENIVDELSVEGVAA